MTFREKWLEAVDAKNSTICAGLDPADFEMGRGDEGIPQGIRKFDWAMRYIEAVAPFVAAVKPNINYWQNDRGMEELGLIGEKARDLGLVVIEDKKLVDIGSTNDAGVYYAARMRDSKFNGDHLKLSRADAVTYAPFPGNLEEAANQAHTRSIGLISLVLMSNPQFRKIKNAWVKLGEDEVGEYDPGDVVILEGTNLCSGRKTEEGEYVRNFVYLANCAKKYNVDAVVIGAPSAKNHITNEEVATVKRYVGDEMLVLMPGVGKQGGEASAIYKNFSPRNVMVNVGRAMMFPFGSNSTPVQHAEVARQCCEMINKIRNAA
ncbi:hypothetical protein AUJ84_01310 [Candidatus Pacearchaeota archaeon CG1_02_32_132]|nr:MAG: hypothetical protein AUJ84_01310 [Candidatus Pacearchaeota archaeon CG1_02_32_132]